MDAAFLQCANLLLKRVDLLLETKRNTFEVGEVRDSRDVLIRTQKFLDLVDEVLLLVLAGAQSLQICANILLSEVLWLKTSSLILAFAELVLKGLTLLRSQISILKLVLEIGSLVQQSFKLDLQNQTETEMLRIGLTSVQSIGDALNNVIIDISSS